MIVSENARNSVNEAIKGLGFENLREYMLDRTGYTLTEMADELAISRPTFYVVHNEWVDANAPGPWPDVKPTK